MSGEREGFFEGVDKTRLYYHLSGEGPPMIACNGIGVSTFFWRYVEAHFRARYTVVTWDYRGHGRSDPPADPSRIGVEDLAEDLQLLIQALELSPAILLGHSMGVQVILEHYGRYPNASRALIPILGSFERPLDTFLNFRYSRPVFDLLYRFAKLAPALMSRIHKWAVQPSVALRTAGWSGLVDRFYCPNDDLQRYLEHLQSMSTQLFLEMANRMADHSAADVLGRIQVPTQIIAGENDVFTPVRLSHEMQHRIPGAELVMLYHGSHAALIEQPEVMLAAIDAFLHRHAL